MCEKLTISNEDICAGVLKTGLPTIIICGLLAHRTLLLSKLRYERNDGRVHLAKLLKPEYVVIARRTDTAICYTDYDDNRIVCWVQATLALIGEN